MTLRVEYEWVVESVDPEGEALGVRLGMDCSYWDEADLADALKDRTQRLAQGCIVDFGLARFLIDEDGEESDRTYIYFDVEGKPNRAAFDGVLVSPIPRRFEKLFPLWSAA